MTVYVCDTPWDDRFYVWGDTPDEAEGLLWAVGADPNETRCQDFSSWVAHRVTPDQFAQLVFFGAEVTGRYGPAMWHAARDGDTRRLEIFRRASDKG